MVWEKIVQVIAVSSCPKCGNPAFDYEPGSDKDDERAMVRCGACGHICPGSEFMRPVDANAPNGAVQKS
jgi:uncharacterized Zn finger protein